MTLDEIVRMAQKAGLGNLLPAKYGQPEIWHGRQLSEIERFAEMVAAHVRQERAQEIEELREVLELAKNGLQWYQDNNPGAVSETDYETMERIDAVLKGGEA